MKTKAYKADCVLAVGGQEFEGVAHVIELEYGEATVFANFVMQTLFENFPKLVEMKEPLHGSLKLEDGRAASVFPFHFHIQDGYTQITGAGLFQSEDAEQFAGYAEGPDAE